MTGCRSAANRTCCPAALPRRSSRGRVVSPDPEQEKRWRTLLAGAEVLFGVPGDSGKGLADAVRTSSRLRWVQATAGGAGEQVRAVGLSGEEQSRVLITRAGGVHAGPLAEFAIFGLLAFTKGLPRLLADKQARRWEHYPMAELAGATVLVVGLGSVGAEVARLAKALGMRVIAVNRTGRTGSPHVDEIRTARFLGDLLPVAHGVVLTLPLTDETRGMIDAAAIGRMHSGAVLVDIGRGGVVDEEALARALQRAAWPARPSTCSRPSRCRPAARCGTCPACSSARTPRGCPCRRTSGSWPCSARTCAATWPGTSCSAGSIPPCSTDRDPGRSRHGDSLRSTREGTSWRASTR